MATGACRCGSIPRGELVITVDATGVVRVGPVDGAEPHLLLGHDGMVWNAASHPTGVGRDHR